MSVTYEDGARYWVRITGQGFSKASTGNTQFHVTAQIMGKINVADPDGQLITCPDYERTVFRVITEKTGKYLFNDVKYLCQMGKLDPSRFTSFAMLDPDTPEYLDFTGVECEFRCGHEVYQGKTKERWSINSREKGELNVEAAEKKDIRKLDALFGKELREFSGGGRQRRAPVQEEVTRTPKGDEEYPYPDPYGNSHAERTPAQYSDADDIPF